MPTDLDARARAAAAALRDAVADAPIPELEAARPSRTPFLLAAAAVLAVLGVLTAAVVLRGDGDGADLATEGPVEVPRLILDPIPEGFEPTGAGSLQYTDESWFPPLDAWLYGDPADPLGNANVAVLTIGFTEDVEPAHDGDRIEVAGHPAYFNREDEGTFGGMLTLAVDLRRDGQLALASRVLDRGALTALAEEAIEAMDGPMPATLGSLDLVASADDIPLDISPLFIPGSDGYGVGYQSGRHVVHVASTAVDEDDLLLARWAMGSSAREVEVRGTTGWISTPLEGTFLLLWEEREGVVTGMMTSLREDATLAAAESLRPATDAEWDALPDVQSSEGVTTFEGEGTEIGTTGGEETMAPPVVASLNGVEPTFSWTADARASGELCYSVDDEKGGAYETCLGPLGLSADEHPVRVAAVRDGETIVVFVLADPSIPSDATAVVLECGGEEQAMRSQPIDDGGFLAADSCIDRADPDVVVVRDGGGAELARERIAVVDPVDAGP